MSGGEGSERAHIAPNPRGRCVLAQNVHVGMEPGQALRTVDDQFSPSVWRSGALGVTRSALAGCISYDGGERAPSIDIASRPALHEAGS
jgi:hypothetical protein